MRLAVHKDDVIFQAYMELFEFHKAYGIPERGNDKYWADMTDKAAEIRRKYEGTEMEMIVVRHLIGIMTMLNRKAEG